MADQETILAAKQRRHDELDAANGETFAAIRSASPDFIMDGTSVRLHMLMEFLKAQGIGTEEDWLDFEISFHEQVKEALEPVLVQIQEAQRRQRQPKLAVVKKSGGGKLLGPDGRPV